MTLTESVTRKLRDGIRSSRWALQGPLPSEKALTEEYGVSRVTIRRALGVLRREGLLVARQGSGYFPVVTLNEPGVLATRRTVVYYYADESGAPRLDTLDADLLNGANAEAMRLGLNLHAISRTPVDFMRSLGNGLGTDLRGVLLDWAAAGLADLLWRQGIPFVVLEEQIGDTPGIAVIQDNAGGTVQALSHLFERGHRRIGILTKANLNGTDKHTRERLDAYRAFLREKDLPNLPRWTAAVPDRGGGAGMARLLDQAEPPTAVFVTAAGLLPGAIDELERRQLVCPRDVSLVAWGGSSAHAAELSASPISIIRWDAREMGRMAMRALQDIVRGVASESKVLRVPTELEHRGSVADCGFR